jgi:ornithine cyclodeaminase
VNPDDVLLISGSEVAALLAGREAAVLKAVASAYTAHAGGHSALPHSTFLRFPDMPRNRIIALPAYLAESPRAAGLKWIASFPENLEKGLDRASAVVILNSVDTGRPQAIIEGSLISAQRTAASAALAAERLVADPTTDRVGLIGCGVINFQILHYLLQVLPGLSQVTVFDLSAGRARAFTERDRKAMPGLRVSAADAPGAVFESASLISFATTAAQPHIMSLDGCPAGSVILHISLRDLSPELILASDNVVDDVDHVSRAETSIHLAEQRLGHRDFIRCTLGDILIGRAGHKRDRNSPTIFSPFGLGILDLAVSKLVYDLAIAAGRGSVLSNFFPADDLA